MSFISVKMQPLKAPYQLMLLASVVLSVFYPTLSSEVSLVDDIGTMTWLFNVNVNADFLRQTILPNAAQGGYYRPLIGLSFLLDKLLWGASEGIMHFEGVLFHLANTFLVFGIARTVIQMIHCRHREYLPLFAALLFGLHPVTTESVNWISGRTDIMMSTMILVSVWFLLRYKTSNRPVHLLTALFFWLLGCLAKESGFAFLIGFVFLLISKEEPDKPIGGYYSRELIQFLVLYAAAFLTGLLWGNYWMVVATAVLYFGMSWYQRFKRGEAAALSVKARLLLVLSFVSGIMLFFAFRKMAFSSDINKISQTIKLMFADLNYTLNLFIGASGFYVKKFFCPFPLNFFILEIDPLYDFVGIAVMLLVVRLLFIRSLAAAFCLSGVVLFLPALPFAFGTIAWTGYAERYIYLSAAFWAVAMVVALSGYVSEARLKWLYVSLTALVVICSFATFKRNVVWNKNVTLMKDTVDNSPRVKVLRDIYMVALVQAGRHDEAKKEYAVAKTLNSLSDNFKSDMIMAEILIREKDFQGAYRIYEDAIVRSKYSSQELLTSMIDLLTQMAAMKNQTMAAVPLHEKLSEYKRRLFLLTNDPTVTYRLGIKALNLGDRPGALALFSSALGSMPSNHYLAQKTRLQISSLQSNR